MRKLFTAAFAALAFTYCASSASAQVPIQGGIFARIGGTFTTGSRPFHDAAGAYTLGTKQPLTWATTDEGFEYPSSLAIVGLSTTPIGQDGINPGSDVTSIDLGIETHIALGLWQDMRLSIGAGGEQELSDPSGTEDGSLGMSLGLVKNLMWKPKKRSGLVFDIAYQAFKRNARPYAKLNMTVTFFLPS